MSGQSSNNSLRLTDAVHEGRHRRRLVGADQPHRRQGREGEGPGHLGQIALAAWLCADPGLQFHTTINDWHTCPKDGEIRASNPCSEYMFLDDTACNLASLNLLTFYDPPNGRLRVEDLRHAIRLWTIVLEISVLMAQFPSQAIARKSFDYRTLGLGFANLGTLLMVMGIPYDSAEGRAIAAALSAILTGEAYPPRPRWPPSWVRSPATRPTARTCCASSATTAGPPTRPRRRSTRASRSSRAASMPCSARRSCWRRRRRSGTGRWSSASGTATATRRSPPSRRRAPSASSWTATPRASSRTSAW